MLCVLRIHKVVRASDVNDCPPGTHEFSGRSRTTCHLPAANIRATQVECFLTTGHMPLFLTQEGDLSLAAYTSSNALSSNALTCVLQTTHGRGMKIIIIIIIIIISLLIIIIVMLVILIIMIIVIVIVIILIIVILAIIMITIIIVIIVIVIVILIRIIIIRIPWKAPWAG